MSEPSPCLHSVLETLERAATDDTALADTVKAVRARSAATSPDDLADWGSIYSDTLELVQNLLRTTRPRSLTSIPPSHPTHDLIRSLQSIADRADADWRERLTIQRAELLEKARAAVDCLWCESVHLRDTGTEVLRFKDDDLDKLVAWIEATEAEWRRKNIDLMRSRTDAEVGRQLASLRIPMLARMQSLPSIGSAKAARSWPDRPKQPMPRQNWTDYLKLLGACVPVVGLLVSHGASVKGHLPPLPRIGTLGGFVALMVVVLWLCHKAPQRLRQARKLAEDEARALIAPQLMSAIETRWKAEVDSQLRSLRKQVLSEIERVKEAVRNEAFWSETTSIPGLSSEDVANLVGPWRATLLERATRYTHSSADRDSMVNAVPAFDPHGGAAQPEPKPSRLQWLVPIALAVGLLVSLGGMPAIKPTGARTVDGAPALAPSPSTYVPPSTTPSIKPGLAVSAALSAEPSSSAHVKPDCETEYRGVEAPIKSAMTGADRCRSFVGVHCTTDKIDQDSHMELAIAGAWNSKGVAVDPSLEISLKHVAGNTSKKIPALRLEAGAEELVGVKTSFGRLHKEGIQVFAELRGRVAQSEKRRTAVLLPRNLCCGMPLKLTDPSLGKPLMFKEVAGSAVGVDADTILLCLRPAAH